MGLLFGVIVGFAYGLCAFDGGLVVWPLRVVGLGFESHGALHARWIAPG